MVFAMTAKFGDAGSIVLLNVILKQITVDKYYTTHTPCFRQMRYLTKMEPTAPFEKLADDPIPVLESIQSAMRKSLEDWDAAEAEFQQRFGGQWEAEYKQ